MQTVSVVTSEVGDEKIISDENVVNAITWEFPCKILNNFTLMENVCARTTWGIPLAGNKCGWNPECHDRGCHSSAPLFVSSSKNDIGPDRAVSRAHCSEGV